MTNPALKVQAEALGITVHNNWNDKRIQEEIEKVQGANQTNPGQASTTQQASIPENAPPPAVSGITPGDTPSPILADPKPEKKEKEVEVLLKAAYWPEEGVRKEIGDKVTVPMSKAKQLISQGKAEIPLSEDD
ncbi:hypothetical protein AB3480_06540 [Rhizobium mongolense]|uniref:hypothetical protein n=1 Tax=Rhizobium mongolense TaxID=57676 RepID=UPI0034A4628B